MIYYLIGHRGAGKTSILKRLQQYFAEAQEKISTFDLDQLIQDSCGKSISEIFAIEGEKGFRTLELETFKKFVKQFSSDDKKNHIVFLSCGAGFPLDEIHAGQAIWIRRPTDGLGRIFLDRPRLDSSAPALGEYLQRFAPREKAYSDKADWVWSVLEGWDHPNEFERDYFIGSFSNFKREPLKIPATLTLFESLKGLDQKLKIAELKFEVRDDILGDKQQDDALKLIPSERVLYSFRKKGLPQEKIHQTIAKLHDNNVAWDWPCELGSLRRILSSAVPTWISLHERRIHLGVQESVAECIHQLSATRDELGEPSINMKLAIDIHSFSELQAGHRWLMQDPAHRSFQPRTPGVEKRDARWTWYRLWMLPQASLAFVREGHGSAIDQPDFAQVLQRMAMPKANWFSAILGDPVLHSRTPSEQFKFFREREMPVFSIPATREDWREEPEGHEALTVLREMGLRAAAVTSPLKLLAGSVNTLYWSDREGSWMRVNTDPRGFKKLFKRYRLETQIAVWGGGGTLDVIQAQVPLARFFSARTGERKNSNSQSEDTAWLPRVLVWAAGDSEYKFIPHHWRPERVLDLSYTESSPAREYALNIGAEYISGLDMFEEQACGQREFWKKYISEDGNGRKFFR